MTDIANSFRAGLVVSHVDGLETIGETRETNLLDIEREIVC